MNIIPFYEATKDLSENSVTITMCGTNRPIHRGHQELIKFASNFGNKIIIVLLRRFQNQRRFLDTGIKMHNLPFDLSKQIQSIEFLMYPNVFYLIRDPDYDIDDGIRIKFLEMAEKAVEKFKDQLPSEKMQRSCKLNLADSFIRKYKLGEFVGDSFVEDSYFPVRVAGPEPEHFIIKAAYSLLVPNSRQMFFDQLIRNPKNDLRFKSEVPRLSESESKAFHENIGSILERERGRFIKGSNVKLVNFLNKKYKARQQRLWNFKEIIVFEDGVFENYRLELTTFGFGSGIFENLYVVKK